MSFSRFFVPYGLILKLSIAIENMSKPLDAFWVHGIPENGTNQQWLNCKLCGVHMTGGISKLKCHLTKIPEHDVGICLNLPQRLWELHMIQLKQRIKWKKTQPKRRLNLQLEVHGYLPLRLVGGAPRIQLSRGPHLFLFHEPVFGAQPSIMSLVKKREQEEADMVMGRCLHWSGIPLNITNNNPFRQPMYDAIVVVGPGYKSATFEELLGAILQVEKKDINSRWTELKQSWDISGCTAKKHDTSIQPSVSHIRHGNTDSCGYLWMHS